MAFWDQDYSEQTIIDIILLVVIFDVFWKEITFNNTIMESCRLVKIYIPSSHNLFSQNFQSLFEPYECPLVKMNNNQSSLHITVI